MVTITSTGGNSATKKLVISQIGLCCFIKFATPKNNDMKKLILSAFTFMIVAFAIAQSPQGMNYQAVVRNASGQPVAANTPVKLRFSIHDASPTGTVVFTETINDTANQFGLVTAKIGSNSNLSTINWGNGEKYLQVETEVNNSGSFTDMGTTQLLRVPYAL